MAIIKESMAPELDEYCRYQWAHGHDTGDRKNLKYKIVRDGFLQDYVKSSHHSRKNP